MSDGANTFLAWLRRGVATGITRRDEADGQTVPRAEFAVTMPFNDGALTASTKLALLGSGDVIGLDPRAVIRVWPRAGVAEAAANYFPLIEFDQADLPWRYTPAAPSSKGRLRPWVCLIALKETEFRRSREPTADRPVSAIKVLQGTPLPNLEQASAWAHVQVSGVQSITATQAAILLEQNPKQLLARLLCPRRLESRTAYWMMLVPTFRRGVLAGLGDPVPDTVDALAEAWPAAPTGDVELPVYYEWQFTSGEAEDFEELVRRLHKTALTEGGRRDMDVSDPGLGLAGASTKPLGLEGAMRAPSVMSTPWDTGERDTWLRGLKQLVDSPETSLTGTATGGKLAPPLCGRWHAARHALTLPPVRPSLRARWSWFDELNGDPRLRVAAALGAWVVQSQQDQLMASAWLQVEGIRRLNEELRWAQGAREIARRVHARHLAAADPEVVIQLTGPVHTRMRLTDGDSLSLPRRLLETPLRPGVLAPQWRRIGRRLGPVGRRQGLLREPGTPSVLGRLNRGELMLAPAPRTPGVLADMVALKPRTGANLATDPGGRPGFRAREYLPDAVEGWETAPSVPADAGTGPDSESARRFRDAVVSGWAQISAAEPPPIKLTPVDLRSLRARLVEKLDPETTIAAFYASRVDVDPGLGWKPETLAEVMVAPRFTNPMFAPLRDLSQEWIFPGLDRVAPNTLSLLEVNLRFIHAYMVGLNHEMARELLWNGYPTDQRGTCFRQFWDPASYYPQPGQATSAADLEDIDPITDWPLSGPRSTLGLAGRQRQAGGPRLVLLLRGDLLRRYPNLVVYAAKAKARQGGDVTRPEGRLPDSDPKNERQPLFGGTLQPDVSFFAFEVSTDQALGRTDPGGWYFVLQEQPSETRFGLDVGSGSGSGWDDLGWPDLKDASSLEKKHGYIDVDSNAPAKAGSGASWPTTASAAGTAADIAYITLQLPVRIAVHGTDVIQP